MGDIKIDFWEMIGRATASFIVLLILARLMGNKQISQLTFFHYATGITIGSIAAEIAAQTETKFFDGMIAMIWWAILTVIVNFLTVKSKKVRVLVNAKPTIIISKGKISEESMRKVRLTLNELNMMLREQSIFSVADVNYAILETNGQLSVMKKAAQETATRKDVKAPGKDPKYIPTEIISDGKLIKENLTELELSEDWVYAELKKRGIGKIEHVFYAEVLGDGSLHVDERTEEK